MEHTPTPWIVGDDEDSDYCLVGPHDGDGVVYQPVTKLHSEANARRIVACVNALAPFTTEQIEQGIDLVELVKQRDQLAEALRKFVPANAFLEDGKWFKGNPNGVAFQLPDFEAQACAALAAVKGE